MSGYAAWSLALAGLVGGSVYAVVGSVVAIAGSWAWLSFVLAGLVGAASAIVYARLATDAGEGGVAFTFLRDLGWPRVAGRVSWLLLVGYTLLVALAAYAFGQLLQPVLALGSAGARALAAAVALVASGAAVAGLGGTERLEVAGVWVKVAALFVAVTFGTMSLVGGRLGGRRVAQRGASVFAEAGDVAFGPAGHVVVPALAALASASVLYATLTAVARLTQRVAEDGELPAAVDGVNRSGVAYRAMLAVGAASAVLAAVLPPAALVEAPSAVFLGVFAVVNLLAFVRRDRRLVAAVGGVGAAAGLVVLAVRTAVTHPVLLAVLLGVGGATVWLAGLEGDRA